MTPDPRDTFLNSATRRRVGSIDFETFAYRFGMIRTNDLFTSRHPSLSLSSVK